MSTELEKPTKPFFINVIGSGHGDRANARSLEMYDHEMTSAGPVYFKHDLGKFVELMYAAIDANLPTDMRLVPDPTMDGATLWVPPFMSQYDALQEVDAAVEGIDLMAMLILTRKA